MELQLPAQVLSHKVFGAQHPDMLTSMGHLVIMYMTQGWQNNVQHLALQVKDLHLWVLRENHPDTLWIILRVLTGVTRSQSQPLWIATRYT